MLLFCRINRIKKRFRLIRFLVHGMDTLTFLKARITGFCFLRGILRQDFLCHSQPE